MKQTNVFKILSAAVIVSAFSISCHVNDTNDQPAASSTDTSMAMHSDAMAPMEVTPAPTLDTMPVMVEKVAPNPAKKGLKGKATIAESDVAKPTGSMEADKTGVYSNVEILPSFPGGYKGLQRYFDENLEYPVEATNDGVEGTVNIMFVVDENGKLTAPHIMGEKIGYGLEAEALRVVKKMPAWNPGKLKGKNVKTSFTLPVRFVLY